MTTQPIGDSGPARDGGRRRPWLVPSLLFLAAGLPRFLALDRRPLHHDEGSNAIFVLRLLHEGSYHYDPANYHGPVLFYASAIALALLGTTTVAFRIVPALLGSLMAPLCWSLRDEVGPPAAAAAGLLVAWSPALVYYSRDNIHEIYFVCLTLLLVVALVRAGRRPSWRWPIVAGVAAGALLATKETAPLVLAALAGAAAVPGAPRDLPASRGRRLWPAIILAILVAAAFYSGGFRDLHDLAGPAHALRPWMTRAVEGEGHGKPWWYFLRLLALAETPILILGLGGLVLAGLRRTWSGLALAVWAGVTLAAYSAIPYKTPWLCLNLVLPLAILAGTFVGAGLAAPSRRWRGGVAVLLVVAACGSLVGAVRVSFRRYDDDREPLVYVQTRRSTLQLVERLETIAAASPDGHAIPIAIVSPDYLPLNWYLRDFSRVAYHGHLVEDPAAPLVIARSDAADALGEKLGPEFRRLDYDLRPGVRLALFERRDLWQDGTWRGGSHGAAPAWTGGSRNVFEW